MADGFSALAFVLGGVLVTLLSALTYYQYKRYRTLMFYERWARNAARTVVAGGAAIGMIVQLKDVLRSAIRDAVERAVPNTPTIVPAPLPLPVHPCRCTTNNERPAFPQLSFSRRPGPVALHPRPIAFEATATVADAGTRRRGVVPRRVRVAEPVINDHDHDTMAAAAIFPPQPEEPECKNQDQKRVVGNPGRRRNNRAQRRVSARQSGRHVSIADSFGELDRIIDMLRAASTVTSGPTTTTNNTTNATTTNNNDINQNQNQAVHATDEPVLGIPIAAAAAVPPPPAAVVVQQPVLSQPQPQPQPQLQQQPAPQAVVGPQVPNILGCGAPQPPLLPPTANHSNNVRILAQESPVPPCSPSSSPTVN